MLLHSIVMPNNSVNTDYPRLYCAFLARNMCISSKYCCYLMVKLALYFSHHKPNR
ncbi:hypothetical protein CODIS_32390 [Candidatus Thiodiazotropha endolucinida]|uniref:Uncharacterized protein n=1 Tax=Candidatus Thiodiazotropha endolucinida TaxID=1655433 RepID=A0A7Z0VK37_9GAMM|nr:hypothetical protein CODIS_32390 [Candidatus Thiodiazotropha endolucinida]